MSLPMTSWLCTLRRSCAPLLAVLTLAGALTAGTAIPATAHSKLSSSTPANGARLSSTPTSLVFSFDQVLQPVPAWDAVLITGPDGSRHPARSVRIEGDTLHAGCDGLGPAGSYTISYRVISGDGHPIAGHITLTLDRTVPGPAAAITTALPVVGLPAWFWIVTLTLAVLLAHGYRRWRSDLAAAPEPIAQRAGGN